MERRYLRNFDLRQIEQEETMCLVIGGGIAGLWAALELARAGTQVTVVVKGGGKDSNSYHAQGGIAAAVGEDDSAALHAADTLIAGNGLCDPAAVRLVTQEGAAAIRALSAAGVRFDTADGIWQRGREGGHNRRRVLHVDGDSTGAGIIRQLWHLAEEQPNINLLTSCIAVDLLREGGRCRGALLQRDGADSLSAVYAANTILATGGVGRLYRNTSNPEGATGDGVAMAYRAGVQLTDLEFVQFHPTVLAASHAPSFLISEAVRGEGARLVNGAGQYFMTGVHPLAELAPRDVVAREMHRQRFALKESVFLDATRLTNCQERFPGIYQTCRQWGFDMKRDLLPVAPAAHYWMGGIRTDLMGRTSLSGLYACGEVACSGLHGANRLASNSLLEGIVLGGRAAAAIGRERKLQQIKLTASSQEALTSLSDGEWRQQISACMEEHVGVARSAASLRKGVQFLTQTAQALRDVSADTAQAVEACNMLTVGRLIALAALWRQETRGGHCRTDYAQTNGKPYHAALCWRRGGGRRWRQGK